jgi:hypothetical protein
MSQAFLLAVVVVTSVAAYAVARLAGAASPGQWRAAVATMLEYLGLSVAFLVLNVVAAAGTVLVVRAATGRFVSVYMVDDAFLVIVSVLQGLVFGSLRAPRKRGDD